MMREVHDDPTWLRSWARTHRHFAIHLHGARSYYWAMLRAARMEARADRLEGREAVDPVTYAAGAVRRVYDEPVPATREDDGDP
jgi:hypothetical protein